MLSKMISQWLSPQRLGRAAINLRTSMEQGTQRLLGRSVRGQGVSHGAPKFSLYEDSMTVPSPIDQVMECFTSFANHSLNQWRKVDAGSNSIPQGHLVYALYSASFQIQVQLIPQTAFALAKENLDRNKTNYDHCSARITYQYQCRFEFITQPGGGTAVSFRTTEHIDPLGHCHERDLSKHYRAPTMPGKFGAIGELFLQRLSAT